jgi:hypothetical protein
MGHVNTNVTTTDMNHSPLSRAIIDLWHISRIALAGRATVPSRYDRMIYVKSELYRTYPDLVAEMSAKKIWFAIEDTLN